MAIQWSFRYNFRLTNETREQKKIQKLFQKLFQNSFNEGDIGKKVTTDLTYKRLNSIYFCKGVICKKLAHFSIGNKTVYTLKLV